MPGNNRTAALRLIKKQPECKSCAAWRLCLSTDSAAILLDENAGLIQELGPFAPGEYIYRRGDEFKSIYSIQCGLVKTEAESIRGGLNVTGFYTCSDLIGLEGIGAQQLPGQAVAINETWLCRISYEKLLRYCRENPELHRQFTDRLGLRIHDDEYKWKSIRNEKAVDRVQYFMLDLHRRQNQCGGKKSEIELLMCKQDIANFLSLTPETFSRALKKLEQMKVVETISFSKLRLNLEHENIQSVV